MNLQIMRRLITVEEYHQMIEAGILGEDEHVELIDGEIIKMAAIGSPHASCVDRLNEFFITRLPGRATVRIQNPVCLGEHSEPEPDLAIVHRYEKGYIERHPNPDEVYLIIEVADSSLEFDREIKLPLYAKAGIPEVWVVDLPGECIEIYQEPSPFGYGLMRKKRGSDAISPLAFPDISVPIEWALGKF